MAGTVTVLKDTQARWTPLRPWSPHKSILEETNEARLRRNQQQDRTRGADGSPLSIRLSPTDRRGPGAALAQAAVPDDGRPDAP